MKRLCKIQEGYLVIGVQEDAPCLAQDSRLRCGGDDYEGYQEAAKGEMPSQIGALLRDQHGIPLVKSVTGSKILRILKAHGLAPEIQEDLYFLIKKAVTIRKHLERNRKDKDSKFRLILVESRIHRLACYYLEVLKVNRAKCPCYLSMMLVLVHLIQETCGASSVN
ncbi:hypothetical protein EJB05_53841 [Eragrostis curvula]|uniref:Ribosomal protein S13/S15 N-terminal domain-containing protein n=1 Tax=Eragrostis curvula TaxID=38414 RepID=A0A5J9SP16_9POAL|nr:hypothetical protein EJB05_53841 [Eragrostis curvula]